MELFGVFCAIALVIYLSMRGLSVIIAAPIATALLILTNNMDFIPSLLGKERSYASNLVYFILNYFSIFMLGAILAQIMDESGAAQSIAEKVLAVFGTDKPLSVMIAIYIISAILTYGGISVFVVVFVLVPLSRTIFMQLKISWHLVPLPILFGAGTLTMTMIPGTPSVQNAIPINYLGTTLTAGATVGMVGAVVSVLFSLGYMKLVLDRSISKNIYYAPVANSSSVAQTENLPPLIFALLPLLLLVVIVMVGSLLKVDNILLSGLLISIVLAWGCLRKYLPNIQKTVNTGANSSLSPVFLTASAVAFGSLVTSASGFKIISDAILNIPGNPLISASIVSAVFGLITGSASGSIGIVMNSFTAYYLDTGVSAELLHRIVVMSSALFANMPHSGVVLTILALIGLSHKQAYFHIFMSCFVVHTASLIAALMTAIIFY